MSTTSTERTEPRAVRPADPLEGRTSARPSRRSRLDRPAFRLVGFALALVLADAALEKFGGDSLRETARHAASLTERAHLDAFVDTVRSVIGPGATIGDDTVVSDAVVGDGASIGSSCELLAGVRVWPGLVIPDGGLRFSGGA